MKKVSSTFCSNCRLNKPLFYNGLKSWFLPLFLGLVLSGCELIKMKASNGDGDSGRQPAARANDSYLYKDELVGIIAGDHSVDVFLLQCAYGSRALVRGHGAAKLVRLRR